MALALCDISRLVHHHLLKQGYVDSANELIRECPDLKGVKPSEAPIKLPRHFGPSLIDFLEEYYEVKDLVIEEMELHETVLFRIQDSLPTLVRTLLQCLKKLVSSSQNKVSTKETADKSVNTEEVPSVDHSRQLYSDAGTNTEAISLQTAEIQTVDNSLVSHTQPADTNNLCFTAEEPPHQQDDAQSESDQSFIGGPSAVDLSIAVYNRLLETGDFHEKMADCITKKIMQSPQKENPSEDGFTQHLDSIVRAIVAETQADPAFESIIQECIGN